MSDSNKAVLLILDGFGIGKDSPYNAISNARMPFYNGLIKRYPHSQLITHGEAVGLPEGVMGNSEVGHMTLGAGRIIFQDLTRISKAIRTQEFFKNSVLIDTIQKGARKTGRVHLMGLLSDGGVHSHMEHLFALLELCNQLQVPYVSVHAFLDGRDTPPNSSPGYIQQLLNHPLFVQPSHTKIQLATLMGRYWAMDRDKRWERVEKAYLTLTGQVQSVPLTALEAIELSYQKGQTDEFVEPVLLNADANMKNGDGVIFFNFRSDRAREITQAIVDPEFKEFDRKTGFVPSAYSGLTTYDKNFKTVGVAFEPQNFGHIFGQWLEQHHLSQFRIAETEKYAHVTFFFNGGREQAFQQEDRVLVPSPRDVPTYDLKPEMSAIQVADEAARRIASGNYHFVLMNFANADMVGHTGNYAATLKALETLDECLNRVISAAEKSGYHVLLTADHGNAEEMRDKEGHSHTQHTLNPVPLIWVTPDSAIAPQSHRPTLKDGGLADIMPTLCKLMNLPIPEEVQGKSLC